MILAATGAALAVLILLLIANFMNSARRDAWLLAVTLLASGAGSLGLALLLLRAAERSRRIGVAVRLVIPSAVAIAVVLLNIWSTAALMFIARHDVVVLAILLSYAGVLALVTATIAAGSITRGLAQLTEAVGDMAGGRRCVRVRVETTDEVGALGRAFNAMAERLEEAALRQREMDEARRTLLAAVSHDLRTPLAAIRVMLEAIEDGIADDPQTVDRYHRAMQLEVAQLSKLIDDLFELSTIEAGALRLERMRLDPAELLAEAVAAMQAEADRAGVALAIELPAPLPPVEADALQVHRVIVNLMANALRHTPPGGFVRVKAEASSDQLRVTIADSGEGIAAADLPHVFERFYRGDKSRSRAGGGAGLGLAIARGVVEAHGGSIHAESKPGEGAAFTFTLPVAAGSA